MAQLSDEFRRIYLPYCIERVEGLGHVVLNRLYKPLGTLDRAHVDYAPHAVRFKGLTPLKAGKISHNGSENTDKVYPYADASAPTRSAANWTAYQARLAVLSKLRVEAG